MECFTTVGSTHFEALIRSVDSQAVQSALQTKGYTQNLLQIGE